MASNIKEPAQHGAVLTGEDGFRVILDSTLTDNRTQSFEVTSDPIEDGTTVANHIIEGLGEFSLTGIVTRTPTWEEGTPTRLEDVQDSLFELAQSKQKILIVNDLHVLPNYAITNVSVSRGENEGQSFTASLSFKQLVITEPLTAKLPPVKVNADLRDSATPTGDAGTQSPVESDGDSTKEEVSKSIASSGFDFLRGAN